MVELKVKRSNVAELLYLAHIASQCLLQIAGKVLGIAKVTCYQRELKQRRRRSTKRKQDKTQAVPEADLLARSDRVTAPFEGLHTCAQIREAVEKAAGVELSGLEGEYREYPCSQR